METLKNHNTKKRRNIIMSLMTITIGFVILSALYVSYRLNNAYTSMDMAWITNTNNLVDTKKDVDTTWTNLGIIMKHESPAYKELEKVVKSFKYSINNMPLTDRKYVIDTETAQNAHSTIESLKLFKNTSVLYIVSLNKLPQGFSMTDKRSLEPTIASLAILKTKVAKARESHNAYVLDIQTYNKTIDNWFIRMVNGIFWKYPETITGVS